MKTPISLFLLLNCLFFSIQFSVAQSPSWIDFSNRKLAFPDAAYFTGFGTASVNKGEAIDEKLKVAESYAKQGLSESIIVTVQSNVVHQTIEENQKIAEEYTQSVVSFSNVNLSGLKTETWFDKKSKIAYAFAWVNKHELAGSYQNLFNLHTNQLENKVNEANHLLSNGQKIKALDTYFTCYPLVRQMEEDLVMLVTIGENIEGKLPGDYESQIGDAIAGIQQNTILNLDELCQLLAGTLKKQLGDNAQTIRLVPFTYQDSKMASELSARLISLFELKLTDQGMSVTNIAGGNSGNSLLLTGTYWEDGDFLKFIAIVKDPVSGKTLASAESHIAMSWLLSNNLAFKPENFEEALMRMKIMTKDELIGGGLLLNIWTNKGDENLLFSDGDIMKLSVRVNHECYLRFIYYFADGTKSLLDDNYYISSDLVNKVVTLPSDYKCYPPFGAETLQVVAQNERFNPLLLKDEDGYKIILENTDAIVNNIRGFKKDSDQKLFAEKLLTITTIKK
jgi:hypothetical protein